MTQYVKLLSKLSADEGITDIDMDGCNCGTCRNNRGTAHRADILKKIEHEIGFVPLLADFTTQLAYELTGFVNPYMSTRGKRVKRHYDVGILIDRHSNALLKQFSARILSKSKDRQDRIPANKLHVCKCCGVLMNTTYVQHINFQGKKIGVCKSCLKNFIVICATCGQHQPRKYLYKHAIMCKDIDGAWHSVTTFSCYSCWEEKYHTCSHCGYDYEKANVTAYRDASRGYDRYICVNCHDQCLTNCPQCNKQMYNFQLQGWTDPRTNDNMRGCDDCYMYSVDILSYGYKPQPKFCMAPSEKNSEEGQLFYGTEIEFDRLSTTPENKFDVIKKLKDWWPRGFVYMKFDRTVENGFELVSQPYTWQHYRRNRKTWQAMLEDAFASGWSGWPKNAGTHFHLSRKAFTTAQLYKFTTFFLKKTHRPFIKAVSERRYQNDAQFCYGSGLKETHIKMAKIKGNVDTDRHAVINLQPRSTVEVRVFAGIHSFASFAKNMELLQSIYEYTLECSLKTITVNKYIEFLYRRNNRHRFIYLLEFLQNNNDITKRYPLITKLRRNS